MSYIRKHGLNETMIGNNIFVYQWGQFITLLFSYITGMDMDWRNILQKSLFVAAVLRDWDFIMLQKENNISWEEKQVAISLPSYLEIVDGSDCLIYISYFIVH